MTVYLDNAATTRVCTEAATAALTAMQDCFWNPSSPYEGGRTAAATLAEQRQSIATALGCASECLYFTSGGTEGNNWAIQGAIDLGQRKGRHIITTAVEHAAVLEPLKALAQKGYELTILKPNREGRIFADAVAAALRPDTILVSMMLVNNELGTVLPVPEVARLIKESSVPALLHTDAVQAFLKIPFTPEELGVDLLTISGHKVRAPKGIGALYLRKGLKFPPLFLGGGQENGVRAGTEPTAQIAAFAAACDAWCADHTLLERIQAVRQYAIQQLTEIPDLKLVAMGDAPHILAISLLGLPSEMLLRELNDRGISVSAGSACHRGRPSHVFAALGLSKLERMGVLRISFGSENTNQDIDALVDALLQIKSERIAVK